MKSISRKSRIRNYQVKYPWSTKTSAVICLFPILLVRGFSGFLARRASPPSSCDPGQFCCHWLNSEPWVSPRKTCTGSELLSITHWFLTLHTVPGTFSPESVHLFYSLQHQVWMQSSHSLPAKPGTWDHSAPCTVPHWDASSLLESLPLHPWT